MKKVLITGKNSYIGTSFENWLLKQPESYEVETLDLLNEDWKSHNFSNFDVVFHVAGIAHVKERPENSALFNKVNCELTVEVAKKAKEAKVKHFVFLSSMSVYGLEIGHITEETLPAPNTAYGKSKLSAEIELTKIQSNDFKIAILRPPMIYGEGCKGNYNALISFANKIPFFPSIRNNRSLLFIDTLCEFVKNIIDLTLDGLFFPQDEEYACTCDMVLSIAKKKGKRIILLPFLNPFIKLLMVCPGKLGRMTRKAFGNLVYDKSMSILSNA